MSISGGGSANGIRGLIEGTTDIAQSSRFPKPQETQLNQEKNGVDLISFTAAYTILGIIVHPSNPVQSLTIDELKAIYQGNITNWEELGGQDSRIVVISRDTTSGTYETWEKNVMGDESVYPSALLQASNSAVVQAVSNNKNAIGYIDISYFVDTVKSIAVNGWDHRPNLIPFSLV